MTTNTIIREARRINPAIVITPELRCHLIEVAARELTVAGVRAALAHAHRRENAPSHAAVAAALAGK